MSSKFITRTIKITFIAVFCFGWMAKGSFLVAENQTQIIRSVKLPRSDGEYSHLCFSTNSKKLYAVEPAEGTLHTWDLSSAKRENQLSINRPVQLTHLVPFDENIIVVANRKGELWNLNLKKKKLTRLYRSPIFDPDQRYIRSMVYDQKNSQLNLIRGNGSVEYLGYQGEQITNTSSIQLKHDIRCAAFSKDCVNFATADWSGNVSVLLANESKPFWTEKINNAIRDVSFGLSKDLLIISQSGGTCWGIDTKLSEVKWQVSCKKTSFQTHISQNGKYLYALVGIIRMKQSKKGTAGFHIHRISDGQLVFQQKLKGDMPRALEVSPDGKFVAALSEGEIYLWNINFDLLEK